MISDAHKNNFEVLKRAMRNDDVALMECMDKDGNEVVVLAIVNVSGELDEESYDFLPLARVFSFEEGDDPYEDLTPPT
jgi:hypothetical protein